MSRLILFFQLYMLRTMVESLISNRQKSIRFELASELIPPLEEFYDHSYMYTVLLQFNRLICVSVLLTSMHACMQETFFECIEKHGCLSIRLCNVFMYVYTYDFSYLFTCACTIGLIISKNETLFLLKTTWFLQKPMVLLFFM